jgi:hypothetical protein
MLQRLIASPKFWMSVPIALLTMSVIMWGTATWIAVSDDASYAIEKDYYQKGLDWDLHLAQQKANADLGWQLVQTIHRSKRGADNHLVEVELLDAQGKALTGASIHLEAFHVAHSKFPQEVDFKPIAASDSNGQQSRFKATLRLQPAGQWEWRWVVHRDDELFTLKRRTLVQ